MNSLNISFIILVFILFNKFILSYSLVHHNKICTEKRILVTGSSSNHFHLLLLMIYNLLKYENNICINVWNLGLSKKQIKQLNYMKISLNYINKRIIFIYDCFNYSNYPSFINIRKNAGEYAWKPIIISNVYNKYNMPLLWLDVGCFIKGSLNKVYFSIMKHTFYTLGAGSTVEGFTHIKTLYFLNASKKIWKKTMCAGGVVGLKYPSNDVKVLLKKWVSCALIKDCIAPKFSDRSNHRQDQSVFSILLYQYNIHYNCYSKRSYNFTTHFDRSYSKYNETNFMKYIKKINSIK